MSRLEQLPFWALFCWVLWMVIWTHVLGAWRVLQDRRIPIGPIIQGNKGRAE